MTKAVWRCEKCGNTDTFYALLDRDCVVSFRGHEDEQAVGDLIDEAWCPICGWRRPRLVEIKVNGDE